MILAIRTDKPEAELYLHDGSQVVAEFSWLAHRQLAVALLDQANQLLERQQLSWQDLDGLVVYRGPGSFTGLRIGIVTAMSAAYALRLPAVGVSDDDWLGQGVDRLSRGEADQVIEPYYGGEPHITQPRK